VCVYVCVYVCVCVCVCVCMCVQCVSRLPQVGTVEMPFNAVKSHKLPQDSYERGIGSSQKPPRKTQKRKNATNKKHDEVRKTTKNTQTDLIGEKRR